MKRMGILGAGWIVALALGFRTPDAFTPEWFGFFVLIAVNLLVGSLSEGKPK